MRALTLFALSAAFLLPGCDPVASGTDKPNTDDTDVPVTDDPDGDGAGIDADCDNDDPTIYPGAPELCDGIDQDCDGVADNGATTQYYTDADGDGVGTGTPVEACEAPDGMVADDGDCDDADATVAPGLPEQCDDKDNDCDGSVDEDVSIETWFRDSDGDGYGDPEDSVEVCGVPDGYVANSLDCDDGSPFDPVHVAVGGIPLPDSGDTGVGSDTAFSSLPGGSSNPLGSIQEGIDIAEACVFVQPGEYTENIDFRGKDILVLGVDGAEDTVIRALIQEPVVRFTSGESADAELRGFTITGGNGVESGVLEEEACGYRDMCTTATYTYRGGGIYIDGASPSLLELLVTENGLSPYSYTEISDTEFQYVYSHGGGIYVANGRPVIERSAIFLNSADDGGGMWVDANSNVTIRQALFVANEASSGGGVSSSGRVTATNAIFAFNVGTGTGGYTGGGAVTVGDGARVNFTNVTLYANSAALGSLYVAAGGAAELNSSIAAVNPSGALFDGDASATLDVSYSTVYSTSSGAWGSFTDGTGTAGNIADDPLFVAAGRTWASTDLHLSTGSPAIDAGDSAAGADADGSANDMGAYGGPGGGW
jgi:hypothetical protein